MRSTSSEHILDQILLGDKEAIGSLYRSVLPKVTSFVLKNRGTKDNAQEIFQDAIYQIIARAKVKGLEITSSFEAYLFTVCKNLWYKELNNRKKEVRNDGVFELKEKEDDDISSILSQDRWDLFEEKLSHLSDKCKSLLKDYFNKVPYDVIVQKFSYASENAAFQRVFKCKKRLTELIQKDHRYKNLLQ